MKLSDIVDEVGLGRELGVGVGVDETVAEVLWRRAWF
jgi:hypothetical protein